MEYAGFWRRFMAYMVDFFVVTVPLAVVLFIIPGDVFSECGTYVEKTFDQDGVAQEASSYRCLTTWVGDLVMIIVVWLYAALMESSARQATLGEMMIGVVVTDTEGNRLSFGRASARYFAKFVSAITLMIGFIMAAFTKRKQALHDIMAGTLVIRKSKAA
jgi:uncharacterized RDD family membrane protein YckC